MEFSLTSLISETLVLLFQCLYRDILSSLRCVLPLLSTFSCDNRCSDRPYYQADSETFDHENRICAPEVNMIMHGLGMKYKLDVNSRFSQEDMERLFDEKEPSFEELKEAFEVFDSNNDGYIEPGDLQRVVRNLGFQDYGLEKCKSMIASCDSNGDGLVDLREFVIFMDKSLH